MHLQGMVDAGGVDKAERVLALVVEPVRQIPDPVLLLRFEIGGMSAGNIVEGLEEAMDGRAVGDKIKVVVPPAKGYGDATGQQAAVPRSDFGDEIELEAGASLIAEDESGEPFPIWIVEVGEEQVVISPDHPLAGVELHFEAQVVAIRPASAEEIDHGHVHGPGGHHH